MSSLGVGFLGTLGCVSFVGVFSPESIFLSSDTISADAAIGDSVGTLTVLYGPSRPDEISLVPATINGDASIGDVVGSLR